MKAKKRKDKEIQKTIAQNRIEKLFLLAEKNALSDRLDMADRYVEIARNISMRTLVPIPIRYKRTFCKHCYSYFLPHVTCRTRINRGKVIFYCFKCNKYTRFPLKNNK